MEKLNLIIITADDLSYGSLGCQKCPIDNISYNLDELSKKSINFTNAHTVISLCQPSRAVLSTGLYPWKNGAKGFNNINNKVKTITEVLKENNYYCSIIGKENHYSPFDKFPWDNFYSKNKNEKNNVIYYNYLKKILNNKKYPFFISCNFHFPHRPFEINKNYNLKKIIVPPFLTDNINTRIDLSRYYASVNALDEGVGMVMNLLEDSKLIDNTLIVFTSDHGFSFPFVKANCYYHSTRVPLMFFNKNFFSHTFCENISSIDFFPTILEILGINHNLVLDGNSYYNEILNKKIKEKKIISCLHKNKNKNIIEIRSIISGDFIYLYNFNTRNFSCEGSIKGFLSFDNLDQNKKNKIKNRKKEELYNYKKDPYCLNDLSEEFRELREKMKNELFEKLYKLNDKILIKIS